MTELLVMDPNEELPGRAEFDITPFVGSSGPNFGDAQIEAYYAQAQLGQLPVDFRIPNRTIEIPLVLLDRDGWTFDELRSAIQQKVAMWQRAGGVIKRQTTVGPVYADVIGATLRLGGSTAQAVLGVDADALLTLEAIPDWYGPDIDLSGIAETSNAELIRVDTPDRGDMPGRVRIIVTDESGEPQLGLLWSFRATHYSDAPTAAVTYEAEDLTPLDAAAIATVTGASGGGSNNVVKHASLGANWTPVLSTDIDGIGPLTHTGSYRIFARCHSTSPTPPRVRLTWDVGDLTNPTPNTPAAPPAADAFYDLDLGEVRIDAAPIGAHRWRGQIQAAGAAGGENIAIDKIWLQALDDTAGQLIAPINSDTGFETYMVRDDFQQSAGNLNGKTASVGGSWATTGAGGSPSDFVIDAADHTCYRADDDAGSRYALIGDMTDTAVQVDLAIEDVDSLSFSGLLVRYVDTNNLAALSMDAQGRLTLGIEVAGVSSTAVSAPAPFPLVNSMWITLQVQILASGRYFVWMAPRGASFGAPIITGIDPACATGGALDSGAVGIHDGSSTATSRRSFDNFAAWVPQPDAVIHAGRALEIRTDGVFRENADGNGYGPIIPIGDLPRLPAPGLEGMPVELLVKASRGDFGQLPDTSIDDLTVQVLYRPSYLYIPDGGPGS